MPRPRTDSTDPAVIARREYRKRIRRGLVAVRIGPERFQVPEATASEMAQIAREAAKEMRDDERKTLG